MFSKQNQNNKTSSNAIRNKIILTRYSINDVVQIVENDSSFVEFAIVVGYQYINDEIVLMLNFIQAKELSDFFKQDGSIRYLNPNDRSYHLTNLTKN